MPKTPSFGAAEQPGTGVFSILKPMQYLLSKPKPDFQEFQDLVDGSAMSKIDINPDRLP